MDRLAEIRARCDAATPGPWKSTAHTEDEHEPIDRVLGPKVREIAIINPYGGFGNDEWNRTIFDGEFIAHAREDIPFLLDVITKLREGTEQ